MGKRLGTLLSLGCLLAAFMMTTLLFYLIYNSHFNSLADDFTGLVVLGSSYESEPATQKEKKLETMTNGLSAWAKKHKAALFYKGFSAAGIAVIDYADWFSRKSDVAFTGQVPETAIVRNNLGNFISYVDNGLLFPGTYNYQIVGLIDESSAPVFQGNSFFYFPLSNVTDMEGLLYTTVSDTASLSELNRIIEDSGRTVEFQTSSSTQSGILGVISDLFFSDFISRSMLFSFLGLIFCIVFAVGMMYRESNRYMVVHHMFGATHRYLFWKILIELLVAVVIGTFIGYLLARTQLYLINQKAYIKIAMIGGLVNILFISLVQVFCFLNWMRTNRGKEGRY